MADNEEQGGNNIPNNTTPTNNAQQKPPKKKKKMKKFKGPRKSLRQKMRENRQKTVENAKTGFMKLRLKGKQQALKHHEFHKTADKSLVSVEEYDKKLKAEAAMKKQQKKIAKEQGIMYNSDGDVTYPALELDAFLSANKKRIQQAFMKLQEKEGFYFSKGLQAKELQDRQVNEGMHMIGVNINALLDLFGLNIKDQGLENIKGDILSKGRSYELIGEHIDAGDKMDAILRDKMGFRMGPDRAFMPEKVLSEFSSFNNIVSEAKNYNIGNKTKLTPNALYKMIKILHKYKKNDTQWLRSATALEIIYQYLSSGMTREEFFKLNTKINKEGINELDEFFKTEHLFMTPAELQLYKKELEFYKYNPEVDTFMNSGSGTTKGTETVISDVSDKDLDDILSNNDDF
jgi:hypothetical protein